MNINKYTIKSQEALQSALELARRQGQQALEPAHLLKSLLELGDSLVDFLLAKLSVSRPRLEEATDKLIAALPKVSGGDPYLSSETNKVLDKAEVSLASTPRSSTTPSASMPSTSASGHVRAS